MLPGIASTQRFLGLFRDLLSTVWATPGRAPNLTVVLGLSVGLLFNSVQQVGTRRLVDVFCGPRLQEQMMQQKKLDELI